MTGPGTTPNHGVPERPDVTVARPDDPAGAVPAAPAVAEPVATAPAIEVGLPRPAATAARSDARRIIALAGPILFTPAALFLVDRPMQILGLPTILVYVFFVWLAGIALTFILARRAP